MTESKPKRRWFRFSLRTLFVLVTIVGTATGLYVHRLRIIKLEREKLAGTWTFDNGLVSAFPVDMCEVGMPSNGTGRIDFHMNFPVKLPDGTSANLSKAIYDVDGDRLRIAQAYPGEPRPTTFEKTNPKVNVFSGKRTTTLIQE